MNGKKIGYIRVSSEEQKPERQLEGIELDKVFIDKISGKNAERRGLKDMLGYAREGDELFVHSMDRLARNLDDLRRIVSELTQKKVKINFKKENLTFTDDSSPIANLMLSVMGAFAEFERTLIRERQLEGIALAKQRGAYKGRKAALSSQQIQELKDRVAQGDVKSQIARDLRISRETLYQYLNK